jgi:hypothetical protein
MSSRKSDAWAVVSQQMVACSGAGDVEELALGLVDLLQTWVISPHRKDDREPSAAGTVPDRGEPASTALIPRGGHRPECQGCVAGIRDRECGVFAGADGNIAEREVAGYAR